MAFSSVHEMIDLCKESGKKLNEVILESDMAESGFAGGDAAKVNAAAARGVLYADGYFADVMAEALKTAECNACMKRIVAAPTAGSCGVLPAVLLPLRRRGLADEAAVHRALYIAAGFGRLSGRGRRGQRHGRRGAGRHQGRHGGAVRRGVRHGAY